MEDKAFFKYSGQNYFTSELCSEKIAYEIAKVLEYKCAKIELAKDSYGEFGILNYWFIDILGKTEHIDAVSYLNIYESNRTKYYTISNIKIMLDRLDKNLFSDFIKIMVFDALIGEQDRHEENWGIMYKNEKYSISPLYDNGCSLLDKFKNEEYADKYYNQKKDFNAFINNSKTWIYDENHKRLKHFELIKYLYIEYPEVVKREIDNLKKLDDKKIEMIVNKIPNELLTDYHKEYIIIYLKKRRDILLNMELG